MLKHVFFIYIYILSKNMIFVFLKDLTICNTKKYIFLFIIIYYIYIYIYIFFIFCKATFAKKKCLTNTTFVKKLFQPKSLNY